MALTYPLVKRELDAPIAFLTKSIDALGVPAGIVNTRTFWSHVNTVAETLLDAKHVINLCENRYLFLVSFCAVILRGQTNLLPPNKNRITQQQLGQEYADAYIVHDGVETTNTLAQIDLSKVSVNTGDDAGTEIPQIADDHLACICFSSGSTGKSKQIFKYWKTLHSSTAINYRHMIASVHPSNSTLYQLATVPAQHMWGLETSILIPLFNNVCVADAKPLFQQDILDTMALLPEPRMLVSTPIHLRALSAGSDKNMSLSVVLCATSPLRSELALDIESKFKTILNEVYGCSEVGSMAIRRTAKDESWLRFDGIDFKTIDGATVASTAYLPDSVPLQDIITSVDQRHFVLSGRSTDLVKIAGKRGSLFEINQVLLSFDGLEDGVIVHPAESKKSHSRLCAIVVLKEGVNKSVLRDFLRERLDNAFVPRPVYVVDALHRESSGKLLKSTVDDLLASLQHRSR